MEKVVFVMHRFRTGGTEKMFINIADQIHQYEIYLVILEDDYDNVYQEIPEHVTVVNFKNFKTIRYLRKIKSKFNLAYPILNVIIFFFQIFCILFKVKIKPNITINFSDTFSTLFITYIFKGRMMSWIHLNPRVVRLSRLNKLYNFYYNKCNKIICICNSQKELFLQLFNSIDPAKVKVVYNTIDISLIDKKITEPVKNLNGDYMLMVSRLDNRSKDFITVIKAYYLIWLQNKLFLPLVIVGEGPDRVMIKDFIESLSLGDNIILVGNDVNPYKWMKNASVFIFSSRSEGFGLVLLEAMYCGVPIISTDCEVGPREILQNGKYGVLVPVGDVEEMKNNIIKTLSNINVKTELLNSAINRARSFSSANRNLVKEIF
ncbi:glycosyltransferase [bacterium]|nr:MAG: glycosyltransferase [bacterium]